MGHHLAYEAPAKLALCPVPPLTLRGLWLLVSLHITTPFVPAARCLPPSHHSLPCLASCFSLSSAAAFAIAASNSGNGAQGRKILLYQGRSPGCLPDLPVPGPPLAIQANSLFLNRTVPCCPRIQQMQYVSYFCLIYCLTLCSP